MAESRQFSSGLVYVRRLAQVPTAAVVDAYS